MLRGLSDGWLGVGNEPAAQTGKDKGSVQCTSKIKRRFSRNNLDTLAENIHIFSAGTRRICVKKANAELHENLLTLSAVSPCAYSQNNSYTCSLHRARGGSVMILYGAIMSSIDLHQASSAGTRHFARKLSLSLSCVRKWEYHAHACPASLLQRRQLGSVIST